MATGYIFNGFAQYEDRDGELGVTEYYAGVPFWLPYQKVTIIPNWTLREVDHDKSTPPAGEIGALVYQNVIVNGTFVAQQLCDSQVPVKNSEKGIIAIEGKPTGKMVTVPSGCSAEGVKMTTDVQEREATRAEMTRAETLAKHYKERVIAEFFQSKRERMHGGKGQFIPAPIVRAFMDELGVEDLDDVTSHQKTGGVDAELIKLIIEETAKSSEVNLATLRKAIATVRKADNEPQVANAARGRRSAGLAEFKAKYDAEHATPAGETNG